MRKIILTITTVVALVALVGLAGCGSKEAQAQVCAGCGAEVAADTPAVDGKVMCTACAAKAAAPAETAAVHDCAGGCGMAAMPEAQMTEIEGKWYCAGCAEKMKGEDHSGHDHG